MRCQTLRAALILIAVILVATPGITAQARLQTGDWSPAQRIPDYGDESSPPFLVADRNRNVYLFNTQPDGDQLQAIFFRQWSVEHGWSPPVDILLSPLPGPPKIEGVYLDPDEVIHLIFFGGDEQYGNFYYTSAPASQAERPFAWSQPVIVGDNGLGISAALAGAGANGLYVIFAGQNEGIGLYETRSVDQGGSWSAPKLVTLMHDNALLPNGVQAILDSHGQLQVVWSEVDAQGIDQAVYLLRLESDHLHWSQTFTLARRDAGDYKAAWPSIIEYNGALMVLYQDGSPASRWMRRSMDGGRTWSDPVRPWPQNGEYNQADLLVDSNDTLHVILGSRNGECCHGMWHGVWAGDHWGALEPIVMGPKTPQFDPSAPQSVISQGNVLLATWWTDTGGGPRNGAWYSYTILAAPELPVHPLMEGSTSTPTTTAPAPKGNLPGPGQSGSSPAISGTPPSPGLVSTTRPFSTSPLLPLLAGLAPVVFLVLGVLWFRTKPK